MYAGAKLINALMSYIKPLFPRKAGGMSEIWEGEGLQTVTVGPHAHDWVNLFTEYGEGTPSSIVPAPGQGGPKISSAS